MVFPEGVKGTGKPFSERYRLQRFGRGGFVEIALRTGAPIVPVAVVGSEEIYPKIADSRPLARATGAPFVPITPTFPWLGPLGLVPAALALADRVLRADRPLRARPRRRRRSAACSSTSPSRSGRRSRRSSTRTWSSAARRSSERRPSVSGRCRQRAWPRPGWHGTAQATRSRTGSRRLPGARSTRRSPSRTPTSRSGPLAARRRHAAAVRVPRPPAGAQPRRERGRRPPPDLVVLGRHGLEAEARSSRWTPRSPTPTFREGRASRSRSRAAGFGASGDRAIALLYLPAHAAALRALPAGSSAREHPHLVVELTDVSEKVLTRATAGVASDDRWQQAGSGPNARRPPATGARATEARKAPVVPKADEAGREPARRRGRTTPSPIFGPVGSAATARPGHTRPPMPS